MTKARSIANLLSTANGKIAGTNLDVSFENISDTGTTGTKVASGTTAQRGTTAGQFRFNSTTEKFEGRNSTGFVAIENTPIVSSVNVSNITQKQINDGFDLVITGQNFATGDVVKFIANDNTEFTAPTTTINSSTQITARVTSNIDATKEPYKVEVTSSGGLSGTLISAFNIDAAPVWTTAAGNLGTIDEGSTANITIAATDVEGDTIAYTETGATNLSSNGFTLGSSTGVIGGTAPTVSGSSTISFNARATSGTNFTDRTFNIIVRDAATGGNSTGTYTHGGVTYTFHKFTSDGNFVLPSTRTIDIFMIAGGGAAVGDNGGGGGAGGLIWRPSLSLSAATYAITIGNGGTGTNANNQSSSTKGTNSTFGSILTALGGGYGGSSSAAASSGGSGGGSGRGTGGHTSGGAGIQTTDSGITADSRTYGFGNAGGTGRNHSEGPGGGGGGASAVGSNGVSGTVGNGGVGHSTFVNSSATETTAFLLGATSGTDSSNAATTGSSSGTLYIGGGGSGGTQNRSSHSNGGVGGLGGGANISSSGNGTNGLVNTGSGGGGTPTGSDNGGSGGSGLVIVRYV